MKTIFKIITIIFLLFPIISQAESDNPFLNFKALKNVSTEKIQSLIDQGYNVNQARADGVTILHVMVGRNRKDIVALLIKAGADVSAIDTGGGQSRALHTAAFRNHPEIVQLLIDAGADIDAKNKHGETPLHNAAGNGSIDVMRILLKAGADPNARTEQYSKTAFMYAARHTANYQDNDTEKQMSPEEVERNYKLVIAMMKLLVEYGADPHAENKAGNTARASVGDDSISPKVHEYLDELGVGF